MANLIMTKYEGAGFRALGRFDSSDVFSFVVCAGSTAKLDPAPSLSSHHRRIRQKLIKNGILREQGGTLVFTADWPFSSISAAACVVCGCPRNGRDVWMPVVGG